MNPIVPSLHYLTKKEIINALQISSATLDNWVRTTIPEALTEQGYNLHIVEEFIKKQNKLESRANKKNNNTIETPKELIKYLEHPSDKWIAEYLIYVTGLIAQGDNTSLIAQQIISLYQSRIDGEMTVNNPLESIIPHNDFYSYSVAYQILLNAGEKSKSGSYYTPQFIVQEKVQELLNKDNKILEPCCGVGFFVIEYARAYISKYQEKPCGKIYFNDLDPISVKITTLNLYRVMGNNEFIAMNIDGLNLPFNNIETVLTNPPYGIKNKYSKLKTTEIFSHFLHKCLDAYMTPSGTFNFILPTSILSVSKHREIRQYILENHTLDYVKHYGKSFDGVFSDVISIQIKKGLTSNNHTLWIDKDGTRTFIEQTNFIENDFTISKIEKNDLKKFFNVPHQTLKGCSFALGIVTGNNSYFVTKEIPKDYPYKNVLSGKEIKQGDILFSNGQYIRDEPSRYQQKPDMNLFKQKKIIYKFISKDIISAVDNFGALTLNSANLIVLTPKFKDTTGLSEEYVSAMLNSSLINEIHSMKHGNPIKVLRKHLEELPIFSLPKDIVDTVEENYVNGKHQENDLIIRTEVNKLLINHLD